MKQLKGLKSPECEGVHFLLCSPCGEVRNSRKLAVFHCPHGHQVKSRPQRTQAAGLGPLSPALLRVTLRNFSRRAAPRPPPHLSILTVKVEPVPTARAVLRLLCQCPAVTLLFKLLPLGDVSDLSQMSQYLALSLPGLSITGERWRACKLPGSYRT